MSDAKWKRMRPPEQLDTNRIRTYDEQACNSLSALSAVRRFAENYRQRHDLRMTDCTAREVPGTSRQPSVLSLEFCLTGIRIDWSSASVSVATWTAQLSTQANGHPLPVARCVRGGLYGGMTERRREEVRDAVVRRGRIFRKEKRGNAAAQSAPAWLFGSMMILGRGTAFSD